MFVIVAVPLTSVQLPVAGARGALAASVACGLLPQMFWSGPALADGADWSYTITATWSVVMLPAQGPLLTVQANTFVPIPSPVMAEFGSFGSDTVP